MSWSDPFLGTETTWVWSAKIVGAVAGSAVSLAHILPKSRREAATRLAVGIICGLVFGGATGIKIAETLDFQENLGQAELMLMGSAAASLAAWSALGIFQRFADRKKREQSLREGAAGDGN